MTIKRRAGALMALAASAALVLAACSGNGGGTSDPTTPADTSTDTTTENGEGSEKEPVTLTWWHNSVPGDDGTNSLGDLWDQVAAEFMADNSHVTINVEGIQNEDLQRTRIPVALQSGDAPDLFQQWGGGELRDQADAGYLMDLSSILADDIDRLGGGVAPWQYDGVTYGLPFQFGVEGIWYRISLFEEAGIDSVPTTMAELNDAVQKLKDAGIVPIAVGAGDGWPAGHWWYNFALRQCSPEALNQGMAEYDFSDACWVEAGEQLQAFIDTEPFQPQYVSTPAQQGATSSAGMLATGNAAMELMGHWNIFVLEGFMEGDDAKAAMSEDLGWFPFPATTGGAGDPTAALGGGDGFSCYKDAPVECAELLSYIASDDVQKRFAEEVGGMPVAPAAAAAVTNSNLVQLAAVAADAAYVQLWLDTDFGNNVGSAMNDGIVALFAGSGDAQSIVTMMSAAAATIQ